MNVGQESTWFTKHIKYSDFLHFPVPAHFGSAAWMVSNSKPFFLTILLDKIIAINVSKVVINYST